MKRILVFGVTDNPGGVEAFLLNYYRNIDREKIQFDFLCNFHNPAAHEAELAALGGRIYHITPRSKNPVLYRKEMNRVFRVHSSEWSAIWVNLSSLANIDYLKAAKKYGIRKRIIHSHASGNMDSKLRGMLHEMNKTKLDKYATDFWACSDAAAKWFFKKGISYKIVYNAIDVDRLVFDEHKRATIRESLGADESTVIIGSIGRLHFEKNQSFSLEVFREFLRKQSNARLVFIGQGNDEQMLREKAADLGDAVVFAGLQSDIQAWLSAFDLFLFPSLFEGLGIAALEAQANGLPVLASEKVIPGRTKVNENFCFYPLERSAAEWAKMLKGMTRITDRDTIKKNFGACGFDISKEAVKLERLLAE